MTWTLYPISEFDRFTQQWDALNQQTGNHPLLDSDFVVPLVAHFANPSNDKLAIYGDIANPEVITLLIKKKFGTWETFQPSQAPIGLWLQQKHISTENVLAELKTKLPFPTLLLSITQQDPDFFHRPAKSSNINTLDYIKTARVTLNGSFDDYWSARGKNLRQNLRRQRNRLERESTLTELKILDHTDEMEQAIIDYGKMESSGWKNELGTAVNINNSQGKFYRDMLANFCNKKRGKVFQYFYDAQLVATDLCIFNEECIVILKTTYDESISTSSPAMLMRQDAFNYIFDHKLTKRIEFYGKVMDWHTKWSDEIRTMFHINYYSFSVLNR